MLLVVAMLLLLPVMMAGASYGLPGAGCVTRSCCALHHCCAYERQGGLEHGKCAEHEHRHHYHERLQLMRENARHADCSAPALADDSEQWSSGVLPEPGIELAVVEPVGLPPLYGGYMCPQRC